MFFKRYLSGYANIWHDQNFVAKMSLVIIMILLLFAFLPTMQFDYVPQDQWRAFRYPDEVNTPLKRFEACEKTVLHNYIMTGRPLVWVTECVEHAAVEKISDFIWLRPINFIVLILTVIYLGSVLSPIFGGLVFGVIAGAAFIMNPGYTFMYFQGITATMVLFSIVLAGSSYKMFTKAVDDKIFSHKPGLKTFIPPFLLFVVSCMIYPAFAFIVFAFAWLSLTYEKKGGVSERIKKNLATIVFYICSSAFYYIMIKISIAIYSDITMQSYDLGVYEFAMQTSPEILFKRILSAFEYFYELSPFNYDLPHGFSLIIVALISVRCSFIICKEKKESLILLFGLFFLFLIISMIILIMSVTPWLFSHKESLATRYAIPWYLILSCGILGLFKSFVEHYKVQFKKNIPVLAVIIFVLPASIIQNKLSFLETLISQIEIEYMRQRLGEWIDQAGYIDKKHLVVVLPKSGRPVAIDKMLQNFRNAGENLVLSSSRDPIQIPWMINALLRERKNSIEKKIKIEDCQFDSDCQTNMQPEANKIVLSYTYGEKKIKSTQPPFIINNTVITNAKIKPIIQKTERNIQAIKASSQLDHLGPQKLLSSIGPGWHAKTPVEYPQVLTINLNKKRKINGLSFLPQDGYKKRAPKEIKIMASNDGKDWSNVGGAENICQSNSENGWHKFLLNKPTQVRFLKVEITANCGDPNYLTLKGLRFE